MLNIILMLILSTISIYSLISVKGLKKEIQSTNFKLSVARELPDLVTEKFKEVFNIAELPVDNLKENNYTIMLPKKRLDQIALNSIQCSKDLKLYKEELYNCHEEIGNLRELIYKQDKDMKSLNSTVQYLVNDNRELRDCINTIKNNERGKSFIGKFGF